MGELRGSLTFSRDGGARIRHLRAGWWSGARSVLQILSPRTTTGKLFGEAWHGCPRGGARRAPAAPPQALRGERSCSACCSNKCCTCPCGFRRLHGRS